MPFTLPLAAGTANTALTDPLLVGLLDYVAAWLNASLSTKLANMAGVSDVGVAADNLFAVEPNRSLVQQTVFPQLFMSRASMPSGAVKRFTVHLYEDMSRVNMRYVFDELQWPYGIQALSGLQGAIRQMLVEATLKMFHADYATGGLQIDEHLGFERWQLEGVSFGAYMMTPGESALSSAAQRGTDGNVQHGHPYVDARWTITELLSRELTADADKIPYAGVAVDISANDVAIMSRTIPSA